MGAFQDYYHLKKETFSIDPWEDAEIFFGATELHEQIQERVESDFVQQRGVPKFFIFGKYGAGKTHTLAHISHFLTTDPDLARDFPTEPLYFDIAPIRAKEKWATVHDRLMNALGLSRLKQAVSAILAGPANADPVAALEGAGVLRFGEDAIKKSQAQIFRNLLFGGRQETLSWEWLKGRQLKIDEAQMLGTETSLSEPADMIACLLNAASLLHVGLGTKPVLLIDEGEALGNLAMGDPYEEFVFAFRRLVSPENNVLGVVASYEAAGGMDDSPRVLQHEAIMRRVDYGLGYIDLTRLIPEPTEAGKFILKVLEYLVDQDKASVTIASENLDTEPEFFPFTPNAIETISAFVTDDPDRTIPSQIISLLSNSVVAAWRRRSQSTEHVLVNEEIANLVMYPEER